MSNKITINNISFDLKRSHDFSWLKDIGNIFCAYTHQDSGNLLFGIETNDGDKKFIKYAGACPLEYNGDPQMAMNRLIYAIQIYESFKHPFLINYNYYINLKNGIAVIFDWFEGRGLHEHWTFNQTPKMDHNSPYSKYIHLPDNKIIQSINCIFEFLVYIESLGYVAVDFYDGSIMYDFENDITKICDIDFFQKHPLINNMGNNFWGSSRVKSPEENIKGALVDNISNVYTLGKMIIQFLKYSDILKNELFTKMIEKAISDDRSDRYNSLLEFYNIWKQSTNCYFV